MSNETKPHFYGLRLITLAGITLLVSNGCLKSNAVRGPATLALTAQFDTCSSDFSDPDRPILASGLVEMSKLHPSNVPTPLGGKDLKTAYSGNQDLFYAEYLQQDVSDILDSQHLFTVPRDGIIKWTALKNMAAPPENSANRFSGNAFIHQGSRQLSTQLHTQNGPAFYAIRKSLHQLEIKEGDRIGFRMSGQTDDQNPDRKGTYCALMQLDYTATAEITDIVDDAWVKEGIVNGPGESAIIASTPALDKNDPNCKRDASGKLIIDLVDENNMGFYLETSKPAVASIPDGFSQGIDLDASDVLRYYYGFKDSYYEYKATTLCTLGLGRDGDRIHGSIFHCPDIHPVGPEETIPHGIAWSSLGGYGCFYNGN